MFSAFTAFTRVAFTVAVAVLARGEPAWLGAWRNVADPHEVIAFEPARVAWRRGDELEFYRARHGERGARLEQHLHVTELALSVADGRLTLADAQGARAFERVPDDPEELLVLPLPLGAMRELPAERVAEIAAELRRRAEEDQRVRAKPFAELSMDDQHAMLAIDGANTARLIELLADVGWIDAPRFGRRASHDAFLIVQHSGDLALMSTILPVLAEEAERGRIEGELFALLHDRTMLAQGYRQRYGSQIGFLPDGRPVVQPIEDAARVDELRARLSLPPLAEYLAFFEKDGAKVAFYEDE